MNSKKRVEINEPTSDESSADEDSKEIALEESISEEPESINQLTHKYLREIYDILKRRQDVTYQNALQINAEMQQRLLAVRAQIKILKSKVKERFAANEEFLKEKMKVKKHTDGVFGKFQRGEKFFIKGSTYFKDKDGRNAPNNEDCLARRRKGEMFPMDFELTSRHVWSISSKMAIVKGIKEQILDHMNISERAKRKKQKLDELLKLAGSNFSIDWLLVAQKLRYKHSPFSCKAMFEVYLHPSLKHDEFSDAENKRLAKAVEKFNSQNWAAIALEVGPRSDYQCFLHYHTSHVFRQGYERWDKSTDELLIKTVEACRCNGVINWSQVAYLFPQKSRAQLAQRYKYVLDPVISHAPFTDEEDVLLLAAVKEYGENFAKFPRSLFPNRSLIQLRSRYTNTLQTRHKICPWTIEDDRILLKFVEEHGMLWKQCAEKMEHRHTRTSCRQRYMVIQKKFKADPNFKLEDIERRKFRFSKSCVTPENWLHKIEELRTNPALTLAKPSETSKPNKRKRSAEKTKKSVKKSAPTLTATSTIDTIDECNPPPQKRYRNKEYAERLRPNEFNYYNMLKYSYNFRFGKPAQLTPIELYMHESQLAIDCLGFTMPKVVGEHKAKCDLTINGLFMPAARRQELSALLKSQIAAGMALEPGGKQLTPNYSTLTALRALCVLSTDVTKKKESKANTNNKTETDDQHEEVEKATTVTKSKPEIKNEVDDDVIIKDEKEVASTSKENEHQSISVENLSNSEAISKFRQRFRALFYQAAILSRLPPASIPNDNFCAKNLTINNTPVETITNTEETTVELGSAEISQEGKSERIDESIITPDSSVVTTDFVKKESDLEFPNEHF